MGIGLKAGRLFTDADRGGAPNVCIINESLARRIGGSPIGQSILRGRDANLRYAIVGIVEDIRSYGLRQPAVDEVFYPLRQLPWPQFSIIAKVDGDPSTLRRTFESAVADIDRRQAIFGFATMQQLLEQSQGSEKAMASVTMAFAVIALFMALVGLYAVLAQSVATRTTEIGVRVALGADGRQIMSLILRYGMAIVGAGIAFGVLTAALGARYLADRLYGVDARDPWIYIGVAVLFAFVGVLACLVPSRRAARLDPIQALRQV